MQKLILKIFSSMKTIVLIINIGLTFGQIIESDVKREHHSESHSQNRNSNDAKD
jgi:hypothetical protein